MRIAAVRRLKQWPVAGGQWPAAVQPATGHRPLATPAAAVLLLVAFALPTAALAQGESGRYYSETGHTLDARFVSFYDEHGAEAILGFPITDSFIDPANGWLIQYLENARLELQPEPGSGRVGVRLAALGEALGGWDPPLDPAPMTGAADGACRYYAESGHNVCHAFLDFYLAQGGPPLFGYPISEFKLEGERIVQYLQAFRLDWYPESAGQDPVRLAPLGRMHFDRMGYDPALLRPRLPADILLYEVLELSPRVGVAHPVTASDGTQTVYVSVRDQNLNPVPEATVVLTIHLAEADRILLLPATDEGGQSQISFDFAGQPRGLSVALDVTVVRGDLQELTRDSFLIWY
jgi:hypothetical protein